MSKVISARYIGMQQTYDLEVDHEDHQFYLTNGMLTSNSHAVSYAIDSYMCAWLLTKHEPEWLAAYAEEYIGSSDKKRAKALSEIKALGYSFVSVDINYGDKTWTIMDGKKFMPSFTTIKGIGDAAVEEILEMRPYNTVYDLLWDEDGNWKHKKFNKKVFENLIKLGAFESMGIVGSDRYFATYKHMHESIIGNWAQLKKKTGRALLDELAHENRDMDEWSRMERAKMHIELVGSLDVDMVISRAYQDKFKSKGVSSVDDVSEGDEEKMCWFVVTDMALKKTKKGKPYAQLLVIGESGVTHKMNIWGYKPDKSLIEPYAGYLAAVKKDSWSMSTVPWKMRLIDDVGQQ